MFIQNVFQRIINLLVLVELLQLFPIVLCYGESQIIGPEGGIVTTNDGIILSIPNGALDHSIMITISSMNKDTLEASVGPLIPGMVYYNGVAVEMPKDVILKKPATLKMPNISGLAPSEQILACKMINITELGNQLTPVSLCKLQNPISTIETSEFPGIISQGKFSFLSLASPAGFVYGNVYEPDGTPANNGYVKVLRDGENVPLFASIPESGKFNPLPVFGNDDYALKAITNSGLNIIDIVKPIPGEFTKVDIHTTFIDCIKVQGDIEDADSLAKICKKYLNEMQKQLESNLTVVESSWDGLFLPGNEWGLNNLHPSANIIVNLNGYPNVMLGPKSGDVFDFTYNYKYKGTLKLFDLKIVIYEIGYENIEVYNSHEDILDAHVLSSKNGIIRISINAKGDGVADVGLSVLKWKIELTFKYEVKIENVECRGEIKESIALGLDSGFPIIKLVPPKRIYTDIMLPEIVSTDAPPNIPCDIPNEVKIEVKDGSEFSGIESVELTSLDPNVLIECKKCKYTQTKGTFHGEQKQTAIFNVKYMSKPVPSKIELSVIAKDFLNNNSNQKQFSVYRGGILYISQFGDDINGNGSKEKPFQTIQRGIDVACDGDRILVKSGIYNFGFSFKGKAIYVTSESGLANTIINGEVEFSSGETESSVLRGFTIQNTTSLRGGIYCYRSSPVIEYNKICFNRWGIVCKYNSYSRISNNIIMKNFTGLYIDNGSSPIITRNVITENNKGPAVIIVDSSPIIVDNDIVKNTSYYLGGGIYCSNSSAIIVNNRIVKNICNATFGGGIYVDDNSIIANNTIVGNAVTLGRGGGVAVLSSKTTISGNIIVGNTGSLNQPDQVYSLTYNNALQNIISLDSERIVYNIIENGYFGIGNVDGIPAFVDPDNNDYHLLPYSDAIDAGDPVEKLTKDYSPGDTIINVDAVTAVFNGQAIWITDGINTEESTVLNVTDTTITIDKPFLNRYLVNNGAYLYTISSAYHNEPMPNGGRVNVGAYGNTEEATVSIPVISALPESLDFGNVSIGKSKSLPLTIKNIGHDTLEVSKITSSQSSFTTSQTTSFPILLSPGESQDVTITFKPDAIKSYNEELTIFNNDKNITINMSGAASLISIPLKTGWNLISCPVQPTDNSIDKVLESIAGKYDCVFTYNTQKNSWQFYISTGGIPIINNLATIDPDKGYWIKMKEDATLYISGQAISDPSIQLLPGWNLVGYKGVDGKPRSEAISSIYQNCISIFAYDPQANNWQYYINSNGLQMVNDLDNMYQGKGYWINASASCLWNPNSSSSATIVQDNTKFDLEIHQE